MDYNIDSCANMFTAGQRQRVMEKIAAFRSTLVSDANLVRTGCTTPTWIPEAPRTSTLLSPNPASDRLVIASTDVVRLEFITSEGKFIRSVPAYQQDALKDALREAIAHKGFSVVIAKHPCMLKFLREKARKLARQKVMSPRS